MKFSIDKSIKPTLGQLVYRKNEYSFDFEPVVSCDFTLLIQYLEIGFDSITHRARIVWGYHPDQNWSKKRLITPIYIKGGLILLDDIESGITKSLVNSEHWKTYFDESTGWVCMGEDTIKKGNAVEFASGVIAVLEGSALKAMWLRPTIK